MDRCTSVYVWGRDRQRDGGTHRQRREISLYVRSRYISFIIYSWTKLLLSHSFASFLISLQCSSCGSWDLPALLSHRLWWLSFSLSLLAPSLLVFLLAVNSLHCFIKALCFLSFFCAPKFPRGHLFSPPITPCCIFTVAQLGNLHRLDVKGLC